jgi:hypothetical protein
VSGTGGTLEYSTNSGTNWSSTLPTYNQTGSAQTILASVLAANGCRSGSTTVGTTVPGTCVTPSAPVIESSNGLALDCNNPSTTLNVSEPGNYTWALNGNPAGNGSSITASTAGTYMVTNTAANGCTATSSVMATFTPDNTPPSITCPATQTLALGANCTATLPNYTSLATTGDNCGIQGVTQSPTAGTMVSVVGNLTVTLTVTDLNGLANSCGFSVTKVDNTAPGITCPTTQTLALGANCTATLPNYTSLATTGDNCGVQGVTQSPTAGTTVSGAGATTVTLTVTDVNGLTNSCAFTVTKVDNTAPGITCPATQTLALVANCTATLPNYTSLATTGDNCGVQGITQSPTAGTTVSGAGNLTVTLTVTDLNGLANSCSFTVTRVDNTAPGITCPPNIIRSTDANVCGAVVAYTNPTYSDNCPLDGPAGLSHLMGGLSNSTFPKGTTAITWQATDGAGLTATCSFTITVNDTQKPSITCPANQTRSTDPGQCSAVVTYPTPTGTDNCGLPAGQPIWISGGTNASGSTATFQRGITNVIWRATDGAGNTQTCTFRVTVNDTEAPAITCPAAMNLFTATNTCSAMATYTNPTFTDNCAPTTGTAVRISGLVSGSTFPVGNSNVVFQATDASGNTRRCTMVVTVTDNQPPVITCPAPVIVNGTGTPCMATVFYGSATASDNCAGTLTPFLVTGLANGSSFPAGVTTSTFRAVAPNGQSSECSFSVTVNCGSGMSNTGLEDRNQDLEDQITLTQKTNLGLSIAPNPAMYAVTVSMEGVDANGGTLLVFDQIGRLVQQQVIAGDQRTSTLQVAEFAPGLYRIMLRTADGMVTKTLVVIKE